MIAQVLLITLLTNFIYCVPIQYEPSASYSYATAVPTKFIASAAPAPIIHAAPTEFIHAAPTARIIHSESAPIYHSAPGPIYHTAAPAPIYHSAAPAPIYHSAPARIIHTAAAPIYHSAPASIYHSATAPVIHAAPIYQKLITPAKIVKEVEAETFDSNPEYSFSYGVNDPHTGDNKHAEESLHAGVVRGSYTLAEPDGTIRKVTYTADKDNGFNAVVEKSGSKKIIAAAPAKIIATAAPAPPTYAKYVSPTVYHATPIISHGYASYHH